MSTTTLVFNKEQFDRLFPFYILVNNDQTIDNYGSTLEKLCIDCKGQIFSTRFNVLEPRLDVTDFDALRSLAGQPVSIETFGPKKTILKGQFDHLPPSDQLLFVGAPGFDSVAAAADAGLFVLQDPDPLFRIKIDGTIIRQNPAAEELTVFQYNGQTFTKEELWKHIASAHDASFQGFSFNAISNGRTYDLSCKYFSDQEYFNAYGRDITHQKKVEEQLMRLSLVASANENGVLFNDDRGKIFWVNEGFCKLVGYSFDEIIGKSPLDFCRGPLTDDAVIDNILRSIGQAESFNDELIHYRKDGSWFWARVKGQAYRTPEDEGLRYFAMIEDITLEKEQEEQLKVLSQIAENNINPVVITDKDGLTTWINKSFTEVTGYSIDEAIGKTPGALLQGADTDLQTVAYLSKQISEGQPFNTEIYNYTKAGKGIWLRIQGQPILNNNGELLGFFALEEDITKERETKQEIQRSETRFRMALEKIGDNVWEHNFKTKETIFSRTNEQLWGYEATKQVDDGKLWWDSVMPEDLHFLRSDYLKYQKDLIDSHSVEYRIVHGDGSIKWIMDRGVVIERDENGKPLKLVGTHTDITKIKQTEMELEQRVKQFKSLSDNIPGVIYEYEYREDGTEGLSYLSPALEKVFGIKPADFLNYLDYIDPAYRQGVLQKNERGRNTLEPFYEEVILNVPNMGARWVAFNSSFSYISQSGAKVFTGFIMDITERKNVEETLRTNEEKYRSIISNMNLGLLEVDNDGHITYANKGFCDMSGYTADELIGEVVDDLFVDPRHADMMEEKQRIRERGIADAYEMETRDKYGNKKWWLISGAPRYNDKAELVGTIGIHLDITEQKEQESELIEARNHAEQLAKIKENFLANMSHEIRTPMNAIMGMSNQLAKTELKPEQQFYLNTILSATDNLLVIINDILDLSKIEAGKLTIENIVFEPRLVTRMATQVLAPKAEEKGLNLYNFVYDENISPVLIGDPYRLNQVLLNLVSNAIKFTESGSVGVEINLMKDEATSQTLQIIVKDTGIGMEQSFIAHLFDKFSQEYESTTRKFGGTGLGMSICKQLVNLMGGEIYVESEKGKGTTVSLVIEFEKGNIDELPQKDPTAVIKGFLSGKKVLVVDDNELNRLVASIILKNHDAGIKEAINGERAVEMSAEEHFDVILMDIQMPVLNGFEASVKIRERGDNTPIIALTAAAIRGEREKCMAAGMNDYISKPFKEEEFLHIIDKWLKLNIDISDTNNKPEAIVTDEPLYDLSMLKDISRGSDAFVKKMVDMFCEQIPTMVVDLKEANKNHDLDKLHSVAHKMKSSLDNLNVFSLKTPIRDLEGFGREKLNDPSIPGLIDKVDTTLAKVIKAMKAEYPG